MVAMMFLSLSITIGLRVMLPIVLTQIVYIPNINNTLHKNGSSPEHVICPIKYSATEDNNVDTSAAISVIYEKRLTKQFVCV